MSDGARGRIAIGTVIAVLIGTGCAGDDSAPIAQNRVASAPVEPAWPMRPLSVALDATPSPDTGVLRADNVSVDARLLVLTADGSSAAFAAITSVLQYLGTPY